MPVPAGPQVSRTYTSYHVCIFAIENRLLVIATTTTINYVDAVGYVVHYAFFVSENNQQQPEEFFYMWHHFFNPNGNEFCSFCTLDPTLNYLAQNMDNSDFSDQEDEDFQ